MNEIQRYHNGGIVGMISLGGEPHPNDYVLYADHLSALAAKDEEIRVLREALERVLGGSMCDPNRGRSNAKKWTTINALTSDVAAARAALAGPALLKRRHHDF